jgi:hypothetical protein
VLREYWHRAQHEHPELSRNLCILIGSFVAGMAEGYVTEHGRGRKPTQEEFDQAVDLAAGYMKGFGFVLNKRSSPASPDPAASKAD